MYAQTHCFMTSFENSFIYLYTPFAVLFSLFILCWLIPKWHFLWSPIYVSTPRPPLTSPLISSALCLCLPLHTFSVKQLLPVRNTTFVRLNNKWEGDKWREDVKIIDVSGSHSSVMCRTKVWLSYCVFTDNIMKEVFRTSFILAGDKYAIPYLECLQSQRDLFTVFYIWD